MAGTKPITHHGMLMPHSSAMVLDAYEPMRPISAVRQQRVRRTKIEPLVDEAGSRAEAARDVGIERAPHLATVPTSA